MANSNSKYAFWDFETGGISKFFDAPVDIGIVATDATLNQVGEISLGCRPSIFSLPSPGALCVTGIGIGELMSRNLSVREFMLEVHRHFEALSPICLVTYNGIAFDDEIYRHTAYRCLLEPYALQFNGNCRLDMLPLARVAHVVQPGVIEVPVGTKGKPNFRLDELAPANGFAEPGAHNAAVDARATVHLARLISSRAPELWNLAQSLWTDKNRVRDLLNQNDFVIAVGWNPRMGTPIVKALVPIGPNPEYPSEYGCFDLDFDTDSLSGKVPNEAVDAICIGTKARPICPVRLNAMPTIFEPSSPLIAALLPDTTAALIAKAQEVRRNAELRETVPRALKARRDAFDEPEHVEQQLYSGGFIQGPDKPLMARFHMADPKMRLRLIDQMQDPRLKTFGYRILFEESPWALPPHLRAAYVAMARERLYTTGKTPWTSVPSARQEIADLLLDATPDQKRILDEYDKFLQDLPTHFPQAA